MLVKWFTPWTNWTWYAVSASVDPSGDIQFFGLVDGLELEYGYFWKSELEKIKGPFGLYVERDYHWTPKPVDEIYKKRTQ